MLDKETEDVKVGRRGLEKRSIQEIRECKVW